MFLKQQYLGFLDTHIISNSETTFGLASFNFKELSNNSKLPDTLEITLSANEVLGKRIEHFFEYCISTSQHYEGVSKNLQIFKEKITIGELDFLIKEVQNNTIIHVELVYKFYVYDQTITGELNRWIGPNRKDSLLQKVDKLKNKQLPLLFKDETKTILKNLNLDAHQIHQQVCFLANLFVPYSLKGKSLPHLNNDCIIGYWIRSEEFIATDYGAFLFYIPKKKNWIVHPKYNEIWFSFEDIYIEIQLYLSQQKSPLVWIKTNRDSYERLFVVWW